MMENRVLQGYQGEAREWGESEYMRHLLDIIMHTLAVG